MAQGNSSSSSVVERCQKFGHPWKGFHGDCNGQPVPRTAHLGQKADPAHVEGQLVVEHLSNQHGLAAGVHICLSSVHPVCRVTGTQSEDDAELSPHSSP